jgi:putative sigma-54 modulation protein
MALRLPAGARIVAASVWMQSVRLPPHRIVVSAVFSHQCESQEASFMNLTISGHHLEVTPALRGYVTSKLERILRHFDQVVDVKVLLTVEKQKEKDRRQRAECSLHVKGNDLFVESMHADLYAAIDELMDKLDRMVVRHKDKVQDHQAAVRRTTLQEAAGAA